MQAIRERCDRVCVSGDSIDAVFYQAKRDGSALPIEQRCEDECDNKEEDEPSIA
jgi:hypothetical protein